MNNELSTEQQLLVLENTVKSNITSIKALVDQNKSYIDLIENLKKPKKWEPKEDGDWAKVVKGQFDTQEEAVKFGEVAQRTLRLIQYVNEFDNGWVADWDDEHQYKYYAYFVHEDNRWYVDGPSTSEVVGMVYMSEGCAFGLTDKLSSGEVEL